MTTRKFRVWRGDAQGGSFQEFDVDVDSGMVVLDVIHRIQARQAGDLAVRWNCKAGKCGSCSMEINGRPRLSCMTRMNAYRPDEVITLQPLKTFPVLKDLVTDVSRNYRQNRRIRPFKPKPRGVDGRYRMY
jgi:succinate dehydrogenase / fumarate reductase, iron-sulfur subunit